MLNRIDFSEIIDIPPDPAFDYLRDGKNTYISIQEKSRILERHGAGRWHPHPLEKRSIDLRSIPIMHHPQEVLTAFLSLAPRAGDLRLWSYRNHRFAYESWESFNDAVIKSDDSRHLFFSPEDARVLLEAFDVTVEEALEIIDSAVQENYDYRIGTFNRIDLFKNILPDDFFALGRQRERILRLLLANAQATPVELLEELLQDEDEEVASAAIRNPRSRPSAQQMLNEYHKISSEDSEMPENPLELIKGETSEFFQLLSHPNFPFDDLTGLSISQESRLRILANSNQAPLRMYVASMKNAPFEIKMQLASRKGNSFEDIDIKEALAYASIEHQEVLKTLMQDQNEDVVRVSTGVYMEYVLNHIDTLSSYGPTMRWREDLDDLRYALYAELPDIDGISTDGYSLNFQAKPYGFHVLPDGQAKIYLENIYEGHDTEDEEEDPLWSVSQSYDWEEWQGMMIRGLERNNKEAVLVIFPLVESFTETNLNGSGTQFDERILAALIGHGKLKEALAIWLNYVLNDDLWSLLLRPFRVVGTYQPEIRETFEEALADSSYFEMMGYGLKDRFEHGWDGLENTPQELLAASDFARRYGQVLLADAVENLADS